MPPDDAEALLDIARAARQIGQFVAGLTFNDFQHDERTQAAVLYALIVMGEATKRLTREFRDDHPDITWSAIAGLRDILVHAYDRVRVVEVFEICTEHVPAVAR